jgi:hypothetical protein
MEERATVSINQRFELPNSTLSTLYYDGLYTGMKANLTFIIVPEVDITPYSMFKMNISE